MKTQKLVKMGFVFAAFLAAVLASSNARSGPTELERYRRRSKCRHVQAGGGLSSQRNLDPCRRQHHLDLRQRRHSLGHLLNSRAGLSV